MKRISKTESPVLAGVIREESKTVAIAEIKNCVYDGADMIDLHMSCLKNADIQTLKEIIGSTKLPVLALNYNKNYDWSDAGYSEQERVNSFLNAVDAGAAGVDMQGYTFHLPSRDGFCGDDKYSFTKNNPKEVVTDEKIISKQCEFIDEIHSRGAEVLLSCHPGIHMSTDEAVELALFLERRSPDIIKIVTVAENEDELIESFKTMLTLKREVKTKVSYHTSGAAGRLSRVINPSLGGHIAFCVDRFNSGSTMEQIDLKTARTTIDSLKRMI